MKEKLYKVCEERIREFRGRIRDEKSKPHPDEKRISKLEEILDFWFEQMSRIEK